MKKNITEKLLKTCAILVIIIQWLTGLSVMYIGYFDPIMYACCLGSSLLGLILGLIGMVKEYDWCV